uniref:TGF_BETA_2 domain-containing protein n=1 Tax=Mesocestoides corti TaxID=53468 RepID=A0A5K3FXI8_MESCO
MRAITRTGEELELSVLVHVLLPLLLLAVQIADATGGDYGGPADLLISKNRPRQVRRGGHVRPEVPDYLLRLRERHEKEWMNFGQAGGGKGPNLGIITSIRHHWHVGNEGSWTSNRTRKWQKRHGLNFRLARFPDKEQLVAGSVRIPVRRRNASIPVTVSVVGVGESTRGEVFVESGEGDRGWLNVPLPAGSLHWLLRRRRFLRLQVDLADTGLIDPSSTPHILTFHRDRQRTKRLLRQQRDVADTQQPNSARPHSMIVETKTTKPTNAATKQRKERRARRKGRGAAYFREKHNSQYLMNQRYIASTCQRRDLMVNFDAVGWSRWVIAPMAYDAGYCYGHCPFPLSSHFNTTNHAIIIHLMYNLQVAPSHIPPPCCTPLTFSPQSLLFFEGDEVVLQVYENMVVETCGCR